MKRRNLLTFTVFLFLIFISTNIRENSVLSDTSGTYVEDFTTTTKLDTSNTDAIGWGTGSLQLPVEDPAYADLIKVSTTCNNVLIDGNYAYLTCGSSGLFIFDISNPTNLNLVGYYNDSVEVNTFYAVVVEDDIAYLANGGDGLFILNVTDKANPTKLGEIDLYHGLDVKVQGNYAYMACYSGGIRIIDVSNLAIPVDVTNGTGSYFGASADAEGITVSGNRLYVTVNYAGLDVYDITTPYLPILLDNIDLNGYAEKVKIRDNRAYVVCDLGGLQIVDISDPYNLTRTDWLDDNTRFYGVDLQDDYVIVTGREGSSDYLLKIYDISDLDNPKEAGFYSLDSTGFAVAASGYYLYVAAGSAGLYSLQIANSGGYFAENYKTSATAQSSYIYFATVGEQLEKVTVTVSDTLDAGTSIDYYVSASGGNWEPITPGVEHYFTAVGAILYWKAELSTSDITTTPILNSITLDYYAVDVGIELLSPANGVYIQDTTPSFDWSDVSGAYGYLIQISTSATFRGVEINESLFMSPSEYTVTTPLTYGQYYYWRIAYYIDYSSYSAFSSAFYFILDDEPIVNEFGVIASIFGLIFIVGISSTLIYIKRRKR